MEQLQIIGLGLSTVDILMRLDEMPTWQSGGRIQELRLDGGGPVGTAMVAAARLGARVGFVGTRGEDELAQLKLTYLTRDGVDVSHVVSRPGAESQVILCYIHSQTGERIFASAWDASARPLEVSEMDRAYLTQADYLHLDGFHFTAALQAAEWMHAAGKQVMLDAGRAEGEVDGRMVDLVRVTDVLVCGAGFAPGLTGKADRWEAADALLAMGPRLVVQTFGEQGSDTLTAAGGFHTPAFQVPVLDTTGAGDVFHGAYLVGLLRGWDLRQIARYASAVSAIKCTRLGGRAGIPRDEEVMAFLRAHPDQDAADEDFFSQKKVCDDSRFD